MGRLICRYRERRLKDRAWNDSGLMDSAWRDVWMDGYWMAR
jgi:hypothetical protein